MKITIYNSKGGVGKTPISTNIAIDKDFMIATNEYASIYEYIFPDDKFVEVDMNEAFPNFGDINVVFDLAGSINKNAQSIKSAIAMSDVVMVPISCELKSMLSGSNTIQEVKNINAKANILVVTTKLQKQRGDVFSSDWKQSKEFIEIQSYIESALPSSVNHYLPLKASKAFNNIFEKKQSIQQLTNSSPLEAYNYRVVLAQFNKIYETLDL